jgi:peptidoglycan/LPS O-acetylase OafA/YrhL
LSIAKPAAAAAPRFLFIDGLRGVASMMVVFYHLYENIEPSIASWAPAWIGTFLAHGNLGVEIFFVLSGFVIAHSVRNGLHSFGYLGRFAVRRSIRLDPALWLTIALEIGVIVATLRFFPSYAPAMPTAGQVAANVFYLQRFLGLPDVVPVFWTLTYEVQFYVALVGSLVVWRTIRLALGRGEDVDAPPTDGMSPLTYGLLLASCILSAAIFIGMAPLPLRGLFVDRWFQFGTGIAVWLHFRDRISSARLAPFFLLLVLATLLSPSPDRTASIVMIFVAAAALTAAGRLGHFHTWLAGPVWQFLGRISYSLYLIHAVVGWRLISLIKDFVGPEMGIVAGLATLAAGVAASVISAWVMYLLVEAPTIQFARKVHLPSRPRS